MDISVIVSSISTKVLFTRRSGYDDRENQVVSRPFVVFVRSRDVHRQRRSAFIHQNVNLAAAFGSIRRIFARILAAQRRRARLAVDRLPLPSYVPLTSVEADHGLEDFLPDPGLLPRLETLVQHTAGHAKPVTMDCFPLTARPQDVPDAIDDGSIVNPRTSSSSLLWLSRQVFFDTSPQRTGDAKVVHIFRFCATLLSHGVTSLCLVLDNLRHSRLRHFC